MLHKIQARIQQMIQKIALRTAQRTALVMSHLRIVTAIVLIRLMIVINKHLYVVSN